MTTILNETHGSISAGFTIRRGAIDESVTLPARGFDLIVMSVSLIHIDPGGNRDLYRVLRRLWVDLSISGKPFLRVPARTLAVLHGPEPLKMSRGILVRDSDVVVLRLSTGGRRVWPTRKLQVSIGLSGFIPPTPS